MHIIQGLVGENRHLEMRANSLPPQETFKAPWKMIIYSKTVLRHPDWKQTLMKKM